MLHIPVSVNDARVDTPDLSVVATVYNDAAIVPLLVERIVRSVDPFVPNYEIVLIDDRSRDNSREAIEHACALNSRVKGIFLARNYGQQIAMTAGINHARGGVVVIMDGDLQHPPERIVDIYHKVKEGNELVYCVSRTRDSRLKELMSAVFWWVLANAFSVKLVRHQLMMKGLSRRLVHIHQLYHETNRVVTGVVSDIGFKTDIIYLETSPRTIGKSHNTLRKNLDFAFDCILGLGTVPLDSMVYMGCLGVLFSLSYATFIVGRYFFGNPVPGFTSLALLVSFFGSAIVIMLGIIGRYVANVYREVRGRPLYIVDAYSNLEASPMVKSNSQYPGPNLS